MASLVATGYSIYSSMQADQNASDEQARLQQQQEAARVANVQQEVGKAQQRTNTALAGAGSRQNAQPTFAGSMLGQLPSLNGGGAQTGAPKQGGGSSGTF